MRYLEHKEQARRASGSLLFYFILGFIGVILSVTLMTMLLLLPLQPFFMPPPGKWAFYEFRWVLLGVTLAAAASMLAASWWKLSSLKHDGGERIARMLGGRLLRSNTSDPLERRLLNVVDEIAIASQTPAPLVYLLDREQGVNAFAAGYTPHQAVLGVTRGSMELLRRAELQALVAHEFSHVKSGDMRLNLRLMGLVHGILFLQYAGVGLLRVSTRGSSSHENDGAFVPGVIAAMLLAAVGSLGGFCGTLLKAGVSRQREYLADAAAVEFTRNPKALVGVLLTIAGLRQGSALEAPRASEASHLYFADGLNSWLSRKLATHPPLEERILRIDPLYQGPMPQQAKIEEEQLRRNVLQQARSEMAGFAGLPSPLTGGASASPSPRELTPAVRGYVRHARRMLQRLPEELLLAARNDDQAPAVLCALVLVRCEADCRRLLEDALLEHSDVAFYDETMHMAALLDQAPPAVTLPLLDVLMPSLHVLPQEERATLHGRVRSLLTADRKLRLFEWLLLQTLNRQLPLQQQAPPLCEEDGAMGKRLEQMAAQCATLLAAAACWGGRTGRRGNEYSVDQEEAAAAYAAGLAALDLERGGLPQTPAPRTSLREVDAALQELACLTPPARGKLLEACCLCVRRSGEVSQAQGELLRGAAAVLDRPLPPLLPGQPLEDAAQ